MTSDYTDATRERLYDTIRQAEQEGNGQAAIRLLSIFCADVDSGRTPEREVLEYLSRCFSQLLPPNKPKPDANTVLNLPREANRPSDPKTQHRNQCLALAVDMLRHEEGLTKEEAIKQVAEEYHLSKTYLERQIYREYKDPNYADPFPDEGEGP